MYIEKQNIPLPLSFKDYPEFLVYKIEREDQNIRLYYRVEGRGMSIHFEERSKHEELPNIIKVLSGSWYGNKGRWTPLERYTGSIICEDVEEMKKISDKGIDFSFKIRKPIFSKFKILTIESEEVGIVKIKCKRIVPQKYEIALFSKAKNQWVARDSISFD